MDWLKFDVYKKSDEALFLSTDETFTLFYLDFLVGTTSGEIVGRNFCIYKNGHFSYLYNICFSADVVI